MKLPLLIVAVALLVASAAAWLFRASVATPAPGSAALFAEQAKRGFAERTRPRLDFALEDLEQWRADPMLVNPAGSYSETRQFRQLTCTAPEEAIERQCADDPEELEFRGTRKGFAWHLFATGWRQYLPEDFFREPPYLHLSGRSYVALALETSPELFATAEWLRIHKRYLRVSELAAAERQGAVLSPAESVAARLDESAWRQILAAAPLVLGPDALFIRVDQEPRASYRVFGRADWDRFFAAEPLVTTPYADGLTCLVREGNLCWRPNEARAKRRTLQAGALAGAALGLLALSALTIAGRRTRAQRQEREARAFMLQTLTHEIRTPAASLRLSLEALRELFDQLPEAAQVPFLRMCDDAQRLRRLIEASQQYLQRDGGRFRFREAVIASVDDYVQGLVEDQGDDIVLHLLGETRSIRTDPYWFGVCLKNLVANALQHGAPPISVRLAADATTLVVTVEDAGAAPTMSAGEMFAPFTRAASSQGLGLGLSVVDRVMRDMGGELRYQAAPTRFSLHLRNAL